MLDWNASKSKALLFDDSDSKTSQAKPGLFWEKAMQHPDLSGMGFTF
jgi:hypothetical protein